MAASHRTEAAAGRADVETAAAAHASGNDGCTSARTVAPSGGSVAAAEVAAAEVAAAEVAAAEVAAAAAAVADDQTGAAARATHPHVPRKPDAPPPLNRQAAPQSAALAAAVVAPQPTGDVAVWIAARVASAAVALHETMRCGARRRAAARAMRWLRHVRVVVAPRLRRTHSTATARMRATRQSPALQ